MSTPQIRTRAVNGAARVRHHVWIGALTVIVLGVAAVLEAVTGWPPVVIGLSVAAVMLVGVVK